jgi:hypothetical protein
LNIISAMALDRDGCGEGNDLEKVGSHPGNCQNKQRSG